jgi:hypothetical protein
MLRDPGYFSLFFPLDFLKTLSILLPMNEIDYEATLNGTLTKIASTRKEIEKLELESAKLRQFFFATLNMLHESKKTEYLERFHDISAAVTAFESSLKNAILFTLRETYPEFLTAAHVRDMLVTGGFDFTTYASNPLASVSTTLRRFKPEEVETTTIEGVAAYRSKKSRIAEAFGNARPLKELRPPDEIEDALPFARGRFNKNRLNK